jgi:hypothetical protein
MEVAVVDIVFLMLLVETHLVSPVVAVVDMEAMTLLYLKAQVEHQDKVMVVEQNLLLLMQHPVVVVQELQVQAQQHLHLLM